MSLRRRLMERLWADAEAAYRAQILAGEPAVAESSQHTHVMALRALRDLFAGRGFTIADVWGAGYHPLFGRVASRLAAVDTGLAHFVGIRDICAA